MSNQYKPKKQTIIWNDIRSEDRPEIDTSILMLVNGHICYGEYDVGGFWDIENGTIAADEITAWAYFTAPTFED